MGDSIQPLPLEVVQLIAAGAVIDSPAAVVRELVENALDAGATRIVLEVASSPWRIQVTDNGRGLGYPDLVQMALPHCTSKLAQPADLWNIHTLGFRGEALHSLSCLSRVTVCSRPQTGAESGYCMVCDRTGQPASIAPIAMAIGTRITIEDLFYPLPARQQAAPAAPQQIQAIQQVVQRLALCHPTVTWQAKLHDRPWFTLWPGDSALHLLPQVLRRIQVPDLREVRQSVTLPDGKGDLYLLLGLPDRCHRRRPDGVIIGLGSRPVQIPELEAALIQALRRSLPRDRFPVAFLHLQPPADHIDWHRTPDKARVYLRHLDLWHHAMQAALDQILTLTPESFGVGSAHQRLTQLISLAEPGGQYRARGAESSPETPSPSGLVALTQVHNRYILAEHPAGLCLIEQHIAHERVIYEELCDRWQIVPLPSPQVLPKLTEAQVTQLHRIGLTVDPFGPDLWAVRTVPAPLVTREDCAEALVELSLGSDWDSALVAIACRTALRNGVPLSPETMQQILNAWQRTRKPQTCPHGRPICLTLNESSLARYFRRHWVVGKSHGIEPL